MIFPELELAKTRLFVESVVLSYMMTGVVDKVPVKLMESKVNRFPDSSMFESLSI
jgi:hypothetical protein